MLCYSMAQVSLRSSPIDMTLCITPSHRPVMSQHSDASQVIGVSCSEPLAHGSARILSQLLATWYCVLLALVVAFTL